jgi:hypothetical protein
MKLELRGRLSEATSASGIFIVNGASGNNHGITELIDSMGKHSLLLYKSSLAARNQGPAGLLACDDTVIIKVNCQWDERGGTNTDLLKAFMQSVVQHPDGFVGEIIVADNGQARRGVTGAGGSFSYSNNNAEDISQSVQNVVDSMCGSYRVSAYLWDNIATRRVAEYSKGDEEDGYVIESKLNPRTGAMVSYPKFKTKFGTAISFKRGIWDPRAKTYDDSRLKVINIPVLKSHHLFGVTGCVKHYLGVSSDQLTEGLGADTHSTVGTGGMGTEMVGTRFPTLNIIDAIWINANPGEGPRSSYNVAVQTNVIAGSTDPVAVDYWTAKYILLQASRSKGYSDTTSMDPDNLEERSFGQWLRLSMDEINRAGYPTTVDESHMNVYVVNM